MWEEKEFGTRPILETVFSSIIRRIEGKLEDLKGRGRMQMLDDQCYVKKTNEEWGTEKGSFKAVWQVKSFINKGRKRDDLNVNSPKTSKLLHKNWNVYS